MRVVRSSMFLSLALLCISIGAIPHNQELTVTGKLVRAMAIGGESTGWSLQLESELDFDGKKLEAVEVDAPDGKRLEELANKRVKATGELSHRRGVEMGDRYILKTSSIEELKSNSEQPSQPAAAVTGALGLIGSEWLLEDLGGSGVIDSVRATLAFPEAAKVSGNGSCNRFFGPAEISGSAIAIGPLGSTRMACPAAVMNQETKYLKALQAAERFDLTDSYLLLHCKRFEKPLRFTKIAPATEQHSGLSDAVSDRDLTLLFGRAWQVETATPKPAPGSIYVFLANGTLLETSCVETYRIATWTAGKDAATGLRVAEGGQPAFTAEITSLPNNSLQLRRILARGNEADDLTLKAIKGEFVCPDIRK